MQSAKTYLTLSPSCSLRLLEQPCIFDKACDELYELDAEAFEFAKTFPIATEGPECERADPEFLDYCLEEGLIVHTSEPTSISQPTQSPIPSLRYLLLHITTRCNLRCAHCFHGDTEKADLSIEQVERVMEEFEQLQGIRLLVSGGEPLMHPQFWEINELFDQFSFRTMLLSNGTLFKDQSTAARLRANEVQVSLDGVGPSHDALRGPGSYDQALKGITALTDAGVDISIATMVHAGNLGDFDTLESVVTDVGAKEWSIDAPAHAGRWAKNGAPTDSDRPRASLAASPELAGSVFDRAFGGGAHFSGEAGWTCGAHLCAVMANGTICKCGFYADSPSGSIDKGLARGWQNIPRYKIDRLLCDCDIVEDCRGGCRYRAEVAGDRFGKDPVLCAANGLPR
jgi:radical SAM protein with 4Fe4S-binding SPASM domain